MTAPNPQRGDVAATIDGEPRILRLTLGSIAQLEAALDAPDLVALVERFESGRPAARDVLEVLAAGLRGAGTLASSDELTDAEIAFDGRSGLVAAYALAGRVLAAAFADAD